MKILSITVDSREIDIHVEWVKEQGFKLFGVLDVDEIITGMGLQTTKAEILFWVMEESDLTALKLKYPSGTFKELRWT